MQGEGVGGLDRGRSEGKSVSGGRGCSRGPGEDSAESRRKFKDDRVGGSADVKSEACASSEVMFWLVSVKDWR